MQHRRGASVVGDIPSVWTGELFRRGKPKQDERIVREATGPDGARFKFSLIPDSNSVTVYTKFREPWKSGWDEFEPANFEVEWVAWSLNSRRPYILCGRCLRRVARAFVTTSGIQAWLYCRPCAGVRFRSQDAGVIERLTTRIDEIRTRLGGEPAFGKVGTPVPPRPKGMWSQTYWMVTTELMILEGMLSEEYETNIRAAAKDVYALVEKAEKQIAEWSAVAGPSPPMDISRKDGRSFVPTDLF